MIPCYPFSGQPGPALSGRDAPPLHHSFKIRNFSSLSKAGVEKISSDKFEAGEYKWKLVIYPNGDKNRDGEDHISLYLTLVDTNTLPAGWQVKVIFNLFVYNHHSDEYFSPKDGGVRRFHAMRTEWGFPKFMQLHGFNNQSNGFLLDDTCVFGAEVFVLKQARKGQCLSMLKEPITAKYTWRVKNFSTLTSDLCDSESFTGGDYRWNIRLYPNGNGEGKGNSVSSFLCVDRSTLPPDTQLFVKFIIRLLDQTNSEHNEIKAEDIFGPSCPGWGAQKFISHAKFKDMKRGFLVDNSCIIEAELTLLGLVNTVP